MIQRLLATTATLAILISGATIGLEAVGLLFQREAPRQMMASIQAGEDQLQRPEAILKRPMEALDRARRRQSERDQAGRTADLYDAAKQARDEQRYLAAALRWAERYRQRRDAERRLAALEPQPEAVEHDHTGAPAATEPERARREAEPRVAAKPPTDEERHLAEALRWAEQYRQRLEAEQWPAVVSHPRQVVERGFSEVAHVGLQEAGQAELKRAAQETRAPQLAEPGSERSSDTHIAKLQPPVKSAPCASPCRADSTGPRSRTQTVRRPSARSHRGRPNRANVGRDRRSSCPFLRWLQG